MRFTNMALMLYMYRLKSFVWHMEIEEMLGLYFTIICASELINGYFLKSLLLF